MFPAWHMIHVIPLPIDHEIKGLTYFSFACIGRATIHNFFEHHLEPCELRVHGCTL